MAISGSNGPVWYKAPQLNTSTSPGVQNMQKINAPSQAVAPTAEGPSPYVGMTPATTANPAFNESNWQNMVNLQRRSTAGSDLAAQETLKRELYGSGLRPGESGIGTASLAELVRNQSESRGQQTAAMAAEQAKKNFSDTMQFDQMQFDKGKWAQEFGAGREDKAMEDMLNYMYLMNQNQTTPYAAYWNSMSQGINS